jgi:DNA-binding NarL/FixJ family response regulator
MKQPTSIDPAHQSALVGIRHPALAEGIWDLLAPAFGELVLVSDEASLVAGAARLQPRLAVLDLSFGAGDGLGLLRRLHSSFPDLRVIVLSLDVSDPVRRAVLAAGADLLILSTAAASELLPAAETLLRGPQC